MEQSTYGFREGVQPDAGAALSAPRSAAGAKSLDLKARWDTPSARFRPASRPGSTAPHDACISWPVLLSHAARIASQGHGPVSAGPGPGGMSFPDPRSPSATAPRNGRALGRRGASSAAWSQRALEQRARRRGGRAPSRTARTRHIGVLPATRSFLSRYFLSVLFLAVIFFNF